MTRAETGGDQKRSPSPSPSPLTLTLTLTQVTWAAETGGDQKRLVTWAEMHKR